MNNKGAGDTCELFASVTGPFYFDPFYFDPFYFDPFYFDPFYFDPFYFDPFYFDPFYFDPFYFDPFYFDPFYFSISTARTSIQHIRKAASRISRVHLRAFCEARLLSVLRHSHGCRYLLFDRPTLAESRLSDLVGD